MFSRIEGDRKADASTCTSLPSQRQVMTVWGVEVGPKAAAEVEALGCLSFGIDDQGVATNRPASLQTAFDPKADEQLTNAFSAPTKIPSQTTHPKSRAGLGDQNQHSGLADSPEHVLVGVSLQKGLQRRLSSGKAGVVVPFGIEQLLFKPAGRGSGPGSRPRTSPRWG